MIVGLIDFSEAFSWPERPIKFIVGYITFIQKDFDEHKSYFVVVWLLRVTQFVRIPQKRKQKLSALGAKVLSFRADFIFCNFNELVRDLLGVVNPCEVGVYAEDQEVHETYYVISPAQRHLCKSILTRKNNISLKKYILLKWEMVALAIEVCG